jgi:hypothetical protein
MHPPVNPLVVVGIMAVAVTVVIGLLYLVRSVEPASGLTVDTNRATVFYGMVSTAFAVLLAFVVLVSFQSFNQGKSGAESEAVAVVQLFRTAAFFPAPERETLQAEIACYARAAVSEWPAMRKGGQSRVVDMWVARMQQTLLRVRLGSSAADTAFSSLLDADDVRTRGRRERLSEARPVVSTPVWFTLAVGGLVVVLSALLFADPRERFLLQACLMSAVTIMVVSGLVLVWFLDHPYENSAGSIRPVEMQRSIDIVDAEVAALPIPCDSSGELRPA